MSEWNADLGKTNHGQVDLMTRIESVISACTKEWDLTAVDVLGSLHRITHEFQTAIDDTQRRTEDDDDRA